MGKTTKKVAAKKFAKLAKGKRAKKAPPKMAKPAKRPSSKAKAPAKRPTVSTVATKTSASLVAKAPKVAAAAGASKTKSPGKPAAIPSREAAPGVDEYVSKVAPWQRTIIEKLRALVAEAAPRAIESYKWGQPVYEHKGPFAYIKAHAAQVNFGFWRGAELDDPKRMLHGEGERMRHVSIVEAQVIDTETLGAFVTQAFVLNDKKGDPTKG